MAGANEIRARDITKDIIRNEGLTGFYKGFLTRMISNSPITSLMFAGYG